MSKHTWITMVLANIYIYKVALKCLYLMSVVCHSDQFWAHCYLYCPKMASNTLTCCKVFLFSYDDRHIIAPLTIYLGLETTKWRVQNQKDIKCDIQYLHKLDHVWLSGKLFTRLVEVCVCLSLDSICVCIYSVFSLAVSQRDYSVHVVCVSVALSAIHSPHIGSLPSWFS